MSQEGKQQGLVHDLQHLKQKQRSRAEWTPFMLHRIRHRGSLDFSLRSLAAPCQLLFSVTEEGKFSSHI
jgi:hypothetical protein